MEIVYLSILTVGQANHQIQYQERRSLRVCLTIERRILVPSYYDHVREGSRMIGMKKNETLRELSTLYIAIIVRYQRDPLLMPISSLTVMHH